MLLKSPDSPTPIAGSHLRATANINREYKATTNGGIAIKLIVIIPDNLSERLPW